MKIHRSAEYIHIDLTGAEAAVLLEELENVRGGSKLPKVRQVCEGIKESLAFIGTKDPPKRERPKLVFIETTQSAVHLGRLGGLKGGKARAEALSPEQRSEISRKAAVARWSGSSEEDPKCED